VRLAGVRAAAVALATTLLLANITPVGAEDSSPLCPSNLGKHVPVVFVHGLLGHGSDWTRPGGAGRLTWDAVRAIGNTYTVPFDYGAHNADWVTSPTVGPQLASLIACLGRRSREGGGAGKVAVVAHSMGGLAARYASSLVVGGVSVSSYLGLAVTIGTPNLGSELAEVLVPSSELSADNALRQARLALVRDAILAFCNAATHPECKWLEDLAGAAAEKDGPRAMRIGTPEMTGLPDFDPSATTVKYLAGDLTLVWKIFRKTYRSRLKSDFVVGLDSAIPVKPPEGGGGGSETFPCEWNLTDQLQSGRVSLPSCFHTELPRDPGVAEAAAGSVKEWIGSLGSQQPGKRVWSLTPIEIQRSQPGNGIRSYGIVFVATNTSGTWQPLQHSCSLFGCNGNGLFGDGLGTVSSKEGYKYGTLGGIHFDSDDTSHDAPDYLVPPGASVLAWYQYGNAVAIVARFEASATAVLSKVSFEEGLTIDLASVPISELAGARQEGFYYSASGLTHIPGGWPGTVTGGVGAGSWVDVDNHLRFRVTSIEADPGNEDSAIVSAQIRNIDQGYEHSAKESCFVLDALGYLHDISIDFSAGPGVTAELSLSVSNLYDSLAENSRASGLGQLRGGIFGCSGDSKFVVSLAG
jgi:pimeloyl-ACP methyl ester carboxylesterase